MIDLSALIRYTTALFIITNPIGNAPAIFAIIRSYSFQEQRRILAREWCFSLLLALFFQYFGEHFLALLDLQDYTLGLCGGILLFFIGLQLIFPHHTASGKMEQGQHPFFVPIATPMLAGPSLLTFVMLYAKQTPQPLTLTLAMVLAWLAVAMILSITPYLQRLLGNRGITALEQLMGMILSMLAIQMVVNGLHRFIETLNM